MFYVYDFNPAAEEFEIIGAFSEKEKAEIYAASTTPFQLNVKPVVLEKGWRSVVDEIVNMRLGKMAEVCKTLASFNAQVVSRNENEIFVTILADTTQLSGALESIQGNICGAVGSLQSSANG